MCTDGGRGSDAQVSVKSESKHQTSLNKKIAEQGVKLVLLGDMSTGKTSLVNRLVKNTFPEKVESTIGFVFAPKRVLRRF